MSINLANSPFPRGEDYAEDPKNPPWEKVMTEIADARTCELAPKRAPIAIRRNPLRLRKNLTSVTGPFSMQFGTRLGHDFLRRINILGSPDAGGPVRRNYTTYDDRRNAAATTLVAALNVLDGTVIGRVGHR